MSCQWGVEPQIGTPSVPDVAKNSREAAACVRCRKSPPSNSAGLSEATAVTYAIRSKCVLTVTRSLAW